MVCGGMLHAGMPHRGMIKVLTPITTFVPGERAYICRESDKFFSTPPTLAEGVVLIPGAEAYRRASRSCRRLPPPC